MYWSEQEVQWNKGVWKDQFMLPELIGANFFFPLQFIQIS